MHSFSYLQSHTDMAAIEAVTANPGAAFFAGGTTLLDLMKLDVITPAALVDINHLQLATVDITGESLVVGANVKNSDLAHHPAVRKHFPVVAEALLAGASAQLRNMATTAGNIMQRTRCSYFRDVNANCNKRVPGSGCDALTGINRSHAVLGVSDRCIATSPSDLCVALVMVGAQIKTRRANGSVRTIPFEEFHLLPADHPERETVLEHGELITHVVLPYHPAAKLSHYLKVRDRASYEFALASAAVGWQLEGDTIKVARVGLGGIATKPWRSHQAEAALQGKPAIRETFEAAALAALAGARTQEHNAFKVELARRTLVYALEELSARS